jgi:hypothetical protein
MWYNPEGVKYSDIIVKEDFSTSQWTSKHSVLKEEEEEEYIRAAN